MVLVFHITDRDLLDTSAPWARTGWHRSPKLGPVLMGRLQSWLLTAGKVTIKPVVDHASVSAVDAHDPPARMAAAVRYRDETCVYPACRRTAESCDLDHIDEYVPIDQGGPPGQTTPTASRPCAGATIGPRPSERSHTDDSRTDPTNGLSRPGPRCDRSGDTQTEARPIDPTSPTNLTASQPDTTR